MLWTRLGLGLLLFGSFVYAWRALDRVPIDVVGQPSMTGPVQHLLERPFFERLAETSGLPLVVNYRTIDTLGIKDDHQLRLLKSGVLDLVSLRFLQNASTEPTLLGIDLLGLNTDFETARRMVEAYAPVLDQRLQENFNTKLLGVWPFGPQVFFCRSRIAGLTDIAGLKIRVGNLNFSPMITSLGGTPVVIPFDDVADALRNGLVDCAISSASSGNFAGWADYSTFYFPLGTHMGLNGYGISLKLWKRFSKGDQDALEKSFREHVDRIWSFVRYAHEDASSCNTGGPCVMGKSRQLRLVEPRQEDYALMRNLVRETTFKDWATRCEGVYPGCADDWRKRVEPVLAEKIDDLTSPDGTPER